MALRVSLLHSTLTKRSTAPWKDVRRSRRIQKTGDFVQDAVVPMFESVKGLLTALTESKSEELEEFLKQYKAGVLKDIKAHFRIASHRLLYNAALTRDQWKILRSELQFDSVTFLPCYRTISRFWNKQEFIADDLSDEQFFELLDNGVRVLMSPSHRISIRSKLRWMLFLLCQYFGHNVTDFLLQQNTALLPRVHVYLDMLLWDDGGRMWGSRNGLFSALKDTHISLKCGTHRIPMPIYWRKYFINRSWTLSAQRKRENSINVGQLHGDEITQWNAIRENDPISYGCYTLYPELNGFTADNGAREKSNKQDTPDLRCGECGSAFDSALSKAGCLSFLDWDTLLTTPEVTPENWARLRFQEIPEHLKDISFSLLSYDNFHNFVGHIKNVFEQLTCNLSRRTVDQIEAQFSVIIGVPVDPTAKTRIWDFISGYQWRLASIHFYSLFEHTFTSPEVKEGFRALFDLLTEIHLINYIYIDRDYPDYHLLHIRYASVLWMYTTQLKELFPLCSLLALDRIYLHKILSHSLKLFRKYCPASSSCETGEGKISTVNRWLRVCSCRPGRYQRKLFLHVTMDEEEHAKAIQRAELDNDQPALDSLSDYGSPVFKNNFFAQYCPRKFKIREPCDIDRMNQLSGDSARIMESKYFRFLCLALDVPGDILLGYNFISSVRVEAKHLVLLVDTSDAMQRLMGCEDVGKEPLRVRYASPNRSGDIQNKNPPVNQNRSQQEKLEEQIRMAEEHLASIEQQLPSYWRRVKVLEEHCAKLDELHSSASSKLEETLEDNPLYWEKLILLPSSDPPRVDYSSKTLAQLRFELRARGLPFKGNKADVLQRLIAFLEEDSTSSPDLDSGSPETSGTAKDNEPDDFCEPDSEEDDDSILEDSEETELQDIQRDSLAAMLGLGLPEPEYQTVFYCFSSNRKDTQEVKLKAKEMWQRGVIQEEIPWIEEDLWKLAASVDKFFRKLAPNFFEFVAQDLDELHTSVQKLYIEYKNLLYVVQKAALLVAETLYTKARNLYQLESATSKLEELRRPRQNKRKRRRKNQMERAR